MRNEILNSALAALLIAATVLECGCVCQMNLRSNVTTTSQPLFGNGSPSTNPTDSRNEAVNAEKTTDINANVDASKDKQGGEQTTSAKAQQETVK